MAWSDLFLTFLCSVLLVIGLEGIYRGMRRPLYLAIWRVCFGRKYGPAPDEFHKCKVGIICFEYRGIYVRLRQRDYTPEPSLAYRDLEAWLLKIGAREVALCPDCWRLFGVRTGLEYVGIRPPGVSRHPREVYVVPPRKAEK